MTIIIGYLLFCFIVSYYSKTYPKVTAFLIFLVGTFISGYRSVTYTVDNIAYVQYFQNESFKTLQESWDNVIGQIGKDSFYYFTGNVFSKIGFSYRGWFVLIAAVFMGGFCYLMYRYSKNYFMSMLFMISLSYYYFSMSGLRQALALGICCFAFAMAKDRKLIPFLILVFVASLFHSSALIFLPMYLIKSQKIGYKQWLLVVVALIIAYVSPRTINKLVILLGWNDNIANYGYITTGLSIFGFVIQIAIIVFSAYFMKKERLSLDVNQALVNAMFVGAAIQAFVINIDGIFRMSMYFSIYGAFAVTEAIDSQKESNRRILYLLVTFILIVYMLRAGNYRYFTMFGDY